MESPESPEHLGRGLSFYIPTPETLDCVVKQGFYLLRQESLSDDLHATTKALGARQPLESVKHAYSDYPMEPKTYLSAKGRDRLLRFLTRDYEILEALKAGAKNLK